MSKDTWDSVFDPERAAEFKNEGSKVCYWRVSRKRPRLCAASRISFKCYCCFGGVVGWGLGAGVAGLVAGVVVGLTGLVGMLPAAGAGTPD